MRRAHRDMAGGGEIAMMAVITKAMGAFLVIMILLLPYYNSGPVNEQIAEEAIESIEEARKQLRETQAAVKKGRLTDEEIDELLKKLEQALRQLEEAQLYVNQLRIQVDQLTAQAKRLENEVAIQRVEIAAQRQEIARLREEIERLKEEIERLKRNQQPEQYFWNTVRLDWKGCQGARLNLYGVSDKADEKGNFNPPPNRTAQNPAFSHDKVYSDATQWLIDGGARTPLEGYIAWVVDRVRSDEVITFYVKYLNALPDGSNQCTLTTRWDGRPGPDGKMQNSVTMKLGEQEPYALLVRLKGGERGALSPLPITPEQQQDFRKQIAASACEGTACGLDEPTAKDKFIEAIVERYVGRTTLDFIANERLIDPRLTERQRGEAVVRALAVRYVEKTMSLAEIEKWTTLLERSKGLRTDRISSTMHEQFVARLREGNAPAEVIELFTHKVRTGYFNAGGAVAEIRAAGLRPIEPPQNLPQNKESANRLFAEWRQRGVDPMIASLASHMVSEGRVRVPVAEDLVTLIHKHWLGRREDLSKTREGEALQQILGTRIAAGPLRDVLNPAATSVPPEQSLPLVRQIRAF